MDSPPACRICSGALVLAHRGGPGPPTAAAFAPTCHTTGAHGDLLRCRECGTVQQPTLPRGEELVGLYREMADDGLPRPGGGPSSHRPARCSR